MPLIHQPQGAAMPLVAGSTTGGAMTLYGTDVASYQGNVDWARVYAAGIRFGFSKVTQSTNYLNPTWSHNRSGMLALGDGFVPGGYHFLTDNTDPAAQARFFLQHAGAMSGLAVGLDVEPTPTSRPTAAQARAWVAEFKRLTGGHPVLGYFPGWYHAEQGHPDLTFFDALWQSRYVSGSGSAAGLYGRVPDSWWASYGGENVAMLQFTSSGQVPGIAGDCDVNAYRGSVEQLRSLTLGGADMELSDKVSLLTKGPDGKPTRLWAGNIMDADHESVNYLLGLAGASLYYLSHTVMPAVQTANAGIAALAKQNPGAGVDEQAIVQGVLAGLSPQVIAGAVIDAMPADEAQKVVDELSKRLAA